MPLCNISIIEFAIDFLISNNIQEIFIICTKFKKSIESFILRQRIREAKIRIIELENVESEGDILREIDLLNIINRDFIVINGDIITNIDLQTAIEEHSERRANDKEKKCLVTKVLLKTARTNRVKSHEDDIIIYTCPDTHEIFRYENVYSQFQINIETIFNIGGNRIKPGLVEMRYDLYDCNIDICSIHLLDFFRDKFEAKVISNYYYIYISIYSVSKKS